MVLEPVTVPDPVLDRVSVESEEGVEVCVRVPVWVIVTDDERLPVGLRLPVAVPVGVAETVVEGVELGVDPMEEEAVIVGLRLLVLDRVPVFVLDREAVPVRVPVLNAVPDPVPVPVPDPELVAVPVLDGTKDEEGLKVAVVDPVPVWVEDPVEETVCGAVGDPVPVSLDVTDRVGMAVTLDDPVFVFDGVFVGLVVLEELVVERAVREAV